MIDCMDNKIDIKSKRFAVAVFLVVFIFSIYVSITEDDSSVIFGGLAVAFVLAIIVFYITKSFMKSKIQFTKLQWVFYIWGLMTGIGNLLFWTIMYFAYSMYNYGEPFFNKDFHRRVEIWGKVLAILFAIGLIMMAVVLLLE